MLTNKIQRINLNYGDYGTTVKFELTIRAIGNGIMNVSKKSLTLFFVVFRC